MILNVMQLENFGLYAGTQVIDLTPRAAGRPIILFGGKNGAGKTTLLEAVRLSLYGRRALGARVSQAEYDSYLDAHINASAQSKGQHHAAVGLEFDYAEAGIVHHYKIRREWGSKGGRISESLFLEKDGAPVSSVPPEEWSHFLQELIPPGVSQLFFFDGEKIASIAEDASDEGLATAMRSLLGVDLVVRLQTDLGLYLARRGRSDDAAIMAELETVVREIGQVERALAERIDAMADLRTVREGSARTLDALRRRFSSEGGEIAVRRDAIERRRDEVRRQIGRCEAELKELANGLLPFAVAPQLIVRFRKALAARRNTLPRPAVESLEAALLAWMDDRGKSTKPWTASHLADVKAFFANVVSGPTDDLTGPSGDSTNADSRLADVEHRVRPHVRSLSTELENLTRELRQIDVSLTRANEDVTTPLLDEIERANNRVGALEAQVGAAEEDIRQLRIRSVQLDRQRRQLLEKQAESATTRERSALAARVAQALKDYETRLLAHKVSQLSREFLKCFRHLLRKPDFIADVRIDAATFETHLIGRDGRAITKTELSAGEKQVYATAMLWALARTSGRALPMIIDTPLGRLDLEHRANLLEHYFPAASHQVIILSTDSEIGNELFARLSPKISHCYRLEYDPKTNATQAVSGYFNDPEGKEQRRALQQA